MASRPRYATDKALQALVDRISDLEAKQSNQAIAAGTVTAVDATAGTADVQLAGGVKTTMYATSGAPYLPQVGDKVMLHLSDGDAVSVAPRQMVSGDLQSKAYVAGSAGWIIDAGGNAEFNDVTVRGTIDASDIIGSIFETAASGQRVWVGSRSGKSEIDFYTGAVGETHPAAAIGYIDGTGNPQLALTGPEVGTQPSASINLRPVDAGAPYTAPMKAIQIDADQFSAGGCTQFFAGPVDILAPWEQITPALSGAWAVGSTGELWVRFRQIGKTVQARGKVFFNGTGCVFDPAVSLEVQEALAAQSLNAFQCGSWVGQLGGASYCGIVKVHPTDEFGNYQFLLPNGNNLGATNPATMIPTDYVHFSITYEVA